MTIKTIRTLADLTALVERLSADGHHVFVRYCRGERYDAKSGYCSRDHQTGATLDGLSANPLTPPDWWMCNGRTAAGYVASSVRDYSYLRYQGGRGTAAYVLIGTTEATGSDNEPLVTAPVYVARLADAVVEEALLECK